MTLYLVRHGLAAAGVADLDPGLAELGHEQARAAATALRGINAVRLVVSPLKRTRETAEPIAGALSLAPEIRKEVAEVFDPSMPSEQRSAMIGPFMAGRWADQPGVLREWRARVVAALSQMAAEASAAAGDLVIVSHYIAIGVSIGEALGDDRVVPAPIANCSITSLTIEDGKFTLIEAGGTAHLVAEQISGIHSAMLGNGH